MEINIPINRNGDKKVAEEKKIAGNKDQPIENGTAHANANANGLKEDETAVGSNTDKAQCKEEIPPASTEGGKLTFQESEAVQKENGESTKNAGPPQPYL